MDYFEAKLADQVKHMNQGNSVIHQYKSYIVVITLPCFANTNNIKPNEIKVRTYKNIKENKMNIKLLITFKTLFHVFAYS